MVCNKISGCSPFFPKSILLEIRKHIKQGRSNWFRRDRGEEVKVSVVMSANFFKNPIGLIEERSGNHYRSGVEDRSGRNISHKEKIENKISRARVKT